MKKQVHSCAACGKSFDRPSTLVKHEVIHTRAQGNYFSFFAFILCSTGRLVDYQCEYCPKKFNVKSNLNRHRNRCRITQEARLMQQISAPPTDATVPCTSAGSGKRKRSKTKSPPSLHLAQEEQPFRDVQNELSPSSVSLVSASTLEKRPRRSPTGNNNSSSHNQNTPWIPASLAGFDLSCSNLPEAPMPLPPVRPFRVKVEEYIGPDNALEDVINCLRGMIIEQEADGSEWVCEERNSYADAEDNPYHP
jgi:hypothetical protein